MKRQGKDFSAKVTPLFETMMVQPQEDMGEDSEIPIDSHHTPTVTQPSTSSQPQQKQKSKSRRKRSLRLKLTELMELFTQLQSRVLALETTKADLALEIKSLKRRVKKLEKKANEKSHKLKRLYKIDLDIDEGVALVDETHERNDQDMFNISILNDEEVVTEVVNDEEVVAKKEVSTANPVPTADEVVTTAGVEVTTAGEVVSTAGVKWIEAFVPMDIELVKASEKAAKGSSKRVGSNLEQKDAKRQRIEEENESAELKRYLEINPDDNDDVKIKAIPLSSKSSTIVDYKIYKEGGKAFSKSSE
nr:hypothetical protein [Tanacetum cinerariifolium]